MKLMAPKRKKEGRSEARPKTPDAKPKAPDELHQVIVRMTHRTWEKLERDAAANFRTINMHILWLIETRLLQAPGEGQP